jgi:hypothetical protein
MRVRTGGHESAGGSGSSAAHLGTRHVLNLLDLGPALANDGGDAISSNIDLLLDLRGLELNTLANDGAHHGRSSANLLGCASDGAVVVFFAEVDLGARLGGQVLWRTWIGDWWWW